MHAHPCNVTHQMDYKVNYRDITTPVIVLASKYDHVVSYQGMEQRLAQMTNAKTQIKDLSHSAKHGHVILGNVFNPKSTDDEALAAALDFCRTCHE